MNMLLLHREFPDTCWSFRHASRFIGGKTAHPPLGHLIVASMLPGACARRLVDLEPIQSTRIVTAMVLSAESRSWCSPVRSHAAGAPRADGEISVHAAPGEGTTFKIYLPRGEEEAPGEAEPTTTCTGSGSRLSGWLPV